MPFAQYFNPETLARNPAFTQAISVPAGARTVYVGGQNAVDASRNVVGRGDLCAQTRQSVTNLTLALESAGARLDDVVKCTIYLVAEQPLGAAFEAWRELWGPRENPPTISVVFVAALANPEFLIEIDAIAAVRP